MVVNNTKHKTAERKCCNSNFLERAPSSGMCLNPDDCAEKMMVLSDSSRLRIIRSLLSGGHNVGEIAKAVNLSVHRVSHHLGIMRLVGLLEAKRQGRNVIYSIRQRIFLKNKGIDLGCCTIHFRAL
jgi:ArsR family transcriptional regulator